MGKRRFEGTISMTYTARRERFREILTGTECVHPGSVWDAISARIAEDIGFETGIFAGSVASAAVMGAPDLIMITLTEFADQIRRVTRASALSLLVDADHGYGNALNVMRTVQECEAAGVAALTIEDTLLPRAFGPGSGRALISLEEGIGKMQAAVAARTDKSLVVLARTSALETHGIEETVKRAQAYEKVGVDGLFLAGIKDVEQLAAVHAATKLPLLIGVSDRLPGRDALAGHGVRVALQGHEPFMATIKAIHETLLAFRQGTPAKGLTNQPAKALVDKVLRQGEYEAARKAYLGG
jgi:carboxyvinyl-carboxyphosphonate phosphorylmutase